MKTALSLLCAAALVMLSCVRQPYHHYSIRCHLAPDAPSDSVTIVMCDSIYDQNIVLHTGTATNGAITFNGHTPNANVAWALLGNDTVPYFFVLEKGAVDLWWKEGEFKIASRAPRNVEYINLINARARVLAMRKQVRDAHALLLADTIPHPDETLALARRDSVLCDSLHTILANFISRGTLPAQIARTRFSTTTDTILQTPNNQ